MKTVMVTRLARLPPTRHMVWSIRAKTRWVWASKLPEMSLPSVSVVAIWPASQTMRPPSVMTAGEYERVCCCGPSRYCAMAAPLGARWVTGCAVGRGTGAGAARCKRRALRRRQSGAGRGGAQSHHALRRIRLKRREVGAHALAQDLRVGELARHVAVRLLGVEVQVVEARVRVALGHAREAT